MFSRTIIDASETDVMQTQVWDVLSNKEAVEVVASAPSRATAARALVDCAVRSWRLKYPTSKNDDCAVVCLFLEHFSAVNGSVEENSAGNTPSEAAETVAVTDEKHTASEISDDTNTLVENLRTSQGSSEIVPVSESREKFSIKSQGELKRSLAECISVADDEEWSALEGITRVNSLLSLPRFLSGDKRSSSWRNWL